MRLSEIKHYKKNKKKHEETQIKNVMQSIKEFGVVQPIVVDKNNTIIIGHCRYEAMKRLGYDQLQEDWVKVVDLSEEEAEKLRLLDNKLNESEWSLDLLLDSIQNIDFSDYMLDWDIKDFEEKEKEKEKREKVFEEMQLKSFEHYDYIVFVFDNQIDWLNMVNEFGLKKVNAGYGTVKKIGLGRVVKGEKLIERLGR